MQQLLGKHAPIAAASLRGVTATLAGATPGSRGAELRMYTELPSEDVTLEEFERLALDRLRVLKALEEAKMRNKPDKELQDLVTTLLAKHLKGSSPEATLRADELSHHILRLAYCRTPDLRKWLLTHECELFRLRFAMLELASDKLDFLQRNELPYAPVPEHELSSEILEELTRVLRSTGETHERVQEIMAEGRRTFFKVPFTKVPDLVAQRKVLLMQGMAYVGKQDLASLVVQEFRLRLSKGLSDINRRWKDMFPDSDSRLRPLVASLSQRYLGIDYSAGVGSSHGEVHLADLPALTQRHFPLCMQHLMGNLAADHHLRHGGRQQLSLFLKGIGLPMDEALVFWRSSFAPRTPGDKFDKEYAYNVRHNYGKEGKRADYSAHSCVSLIRQTAGRDDHHGCPYRRLDENTLRGMLGRAKCEDSKIEEALAKVRGGHFQLACGLALEGVARAPCDAGICHPVQYYSESRRIADERDPSTANAGAPAAAPPSGAQGEGGPTAGRAAGAMDVDMAAVPQQPARTAGQSGRGLAQTPPKAGGQ